MAALLVVAGCRGGGGGGVEGGAAGDRTQRGPSPSAAAGEPPRSDRVLRVVATSSVVAGWARQIGQGNVRTHVVVKAGLDPVGHVPTTVDVAALRDAELVLAVGRGLEPWLEQARGDARSTAEVVQLADGLPSRRTPSGADDPFVWQDADHARRMVGALAAALGRRSPPDAPAFDLARDQVLAQLERADLDARRILAPVAGRPLVTAKEDMGWFAARYGLAYVGGVIPSTTATAEPTAESLARLRAAVAAAPPAAVAGESSTPEGPVLAFAGELGIPALVGDSALHAAGVGPAGRGADTWATALVHDARVLAAALR